MLAVLAIVQAVKIQCYMALEAQRQPFDTINVHGRVVIVITSFSALFAATKSVCTY